MLDRLNALVETIPKDKLGPLLDESFAAFNGAGYDIGSLIDSGTTITRDLNRVADQTRTLIDDSGPLLDAQAATADSTRQWARGVAGITDQLTENDARFRTLLRDGPDFAREVTNLLDQVKPTLPVLLANLTTVGQVLRYRHRRVRRATAGAARPHLFGCAPGEVLDWLRASTTRRESPWATSPSRSPTPGLHRGIPTSFAMALPADTTEVDTPDGLYCKLPHDSPVAVRGASNLVLEHQEQLARDSASWTSGHRFRPQSGDQRPAPVRGIPLRSGHSSLGVWHQTRWRHNKAILYAPVEGTAPPPGQPPVAAAQYNPETGAYMAPDGRLYQQSKSARPNRRHPGPT